MKKDRSGPFKSNTRVSKKKKKIQGPRKKDISLYSNISLLGDLKFVKKDKRLKFDPLFIV